MIYSRACARFSIQANQKSYLEFVEFLLLTLSLPDWTKLSPLIVILLCLKPDDFTHQGRASGEG